MKRYVTFSNFIFFILASFLFNSFTLIRAIPILLALIIPLFLVINVLPGLFPKETKSLRLILCNHGTAVLFIFLLSLIPSIAWHVILLTRTPYPEGFIDVLFSVIFCIVLSSVFFWNGIVSVYVTSIQMGMKWRIIGFLCSLIPILNLIILIQILRITSAELEFEIEKEKITSDPALAEICKTKYPIVLVHGIFFRDTKIINYWGRIPSTLKAHGATIYYSQHQSALSIKESAREIAYRIKLIVERSGCEKVNIIAHSRGGLDCRYALSEFGLTPFVASLTTINTPHKGCFFTDKLLKSTPSKIKCKIAKAYNSILRVAGDENPDFLAALDDLSPEYCKELNETLTLPEGVFAQSFGSVMTHPKNKKFPLNLSYRYIKSFDGENDGLVGVDSFNWGEKYTLLRTEGRKCISHGDMIDLNRENIKDFDVRAFYTELVSDLRKRGL